MTSDETPGDPASTPIPPQRTPRDERIRAASAEYADRARAGDLAALLAPYHR